LGGHNGLIAGILGGHGRGHEYLAVPSEWRLVPRHLQHICQKARGVRHFRLIAKYVNHKRRRWLRHKHQRLRDRLEPIPFALASSITIRGAGEIYLPLHRIRPA
jgi:hypothetical protein